MPLSLESLLGQAAYLLADMRDHLRKQSPWDSRASYLVEECNDFFSEATTSLTILTATPTSTTPISAPIAGKSGLGWIPAHSLDGIRTEPSVLFTPLEPSLTEPFSPSQVGASPRTCPPLSSCTKPPGTLNGISGRLMVDFF